MAPSAATRVRAELYTVSAGAWLLITIEAVAIGPVAMHAMSRADGVLGLASSSAGWLMMLTAMMAPMLAAPVRHLQVRCLARRRARAITLFLAGYVVIWLAAGLVLGLVAQALLGLGRVTALIVAAAFVLAWQASPGKDRCLNRTHAHPPLPAFGHANDRAALRFGLTHGSWCLGSCWAIMAVILVVPPAAGLAVMVGATAWLTAERLETPMTPRWRLRPPTTASRRVLKATRRFSATTARTRPAQLHAIG